MSFFKEKVDLEDFCRKFYENSYLPSANATLDFSAAYRETLKKLLSKEDSRFSDVSEESFAVAIYGLQFELFALAWTHKFVSGKELVRQATFTKKYLEQRNVPEILEVMQRYNKYIDGGTLHWLSNLGKMNMTFWYGMRKDLAVKNQEAVTEYETDNQILEMVNNRLCSENAWRQRILLPGLITAMCELLNLDPESLSQESLVGLGGAMIGIYNGASEALGKIRIA